MALSPSPNPPSTSSPPTPVDLALPLQRGLAPLATHPMVTRSMIGNLKPKLFLITHHPLSLTPPLEFKIEPTCYTQAKQHLAWRQAMDAEYNSLISNGTWSLVPPPSTKNVIGCKWVFRQRKADGSIDRHKARLVALGCSQQEGLDFHETFSPVVKPATIRLILSITFSRQWPIRQLDVQNAFLHGFLREEVYMRQPSGYIHPSHPHLVCRLHKSLYGLKQAPRAWFQRLSSLLISLGFRASLSDASLFIYNDGTHEMFLLIYVDDFLITGSSEALLHRLVSFMGVHFAMKDLGPLHYFLGIEASFQGSTLLLSQTKYIVDLLRRSHMDLAKPVLTPCTTGQKLSREDGEPLLDPTEYRRTVGALQYLTLTRPDISFAVSQVSQFMHHPTTIHLVAVKRLLRYLKATMHLAFCIHRSSLINLTAYSDAD